MADQPTITEMDDHLLIKARELAQVEAVVSYYVKNGYEQLDTAKPLGNNWIATVRRLTVRAERALVTATRIGLQTVLEAPTRTLVDEHIEQMTTHGAVLVAGPEHVDGRWVAVIDDKATAGPRRPG